MVANGDDRPGRRDAGGGCWLDEIGFGELVERHRWELQVHCYRMLASRGDAEDVVQETLLRAWRSRASVHGPSTVRAWLYRIATNACLDQLRKVQREVHGDPRAEAQGRRRPLTEISWLEPFPDQLLDRVAVREAEPDAVVVSKETIELAFIAAIQYLTPPQRAVFILRDVLGWSASDAATVLGTSTASVNSALGRARVCLREHLPRRRSEWSRTADSEGADQRLLRRYIDAHERADLAALTALLRTDARTVMPPERRWFRGSAEIGAMLAPVFDRSAPDYLGQLRMLPLRANRQLAAANYLRRSGDSTYRAFGLDVLQIDRGQIVEVTSFPALDFAAFGLPSTLT